MICRCGRKLHLVKNEKIKNDVCLSKKCGQSYRIPVVVDKKVFGEQAKNS